MPPSVVVIGSANADVVLSVERVPRPGETVLATHRADHAGGKGLNQAIAAARAGASTALLAAVGRDEPGDRLAAVVAGDGIGVGLLRRVDQRTGTAVVCVQADGDNAIVVDAGANAALTGLSAADRAAIAGADVLVAQLEVPVEGVLAAARAAHEGGTCVVLNAAPSREVPGELTELVDVLVVNEHEAAAMVGALGRGGAAGEDPGSRSPEDLAALLLQRVPAVVLTLGAQGALVARRGEEAVRVAAPVVEVVDTTGAGDTAVGYLAAALVGGDDLVRAVRRAVVAASVSTRTAGAVPSIPHVRALAAALR